MTAELEVPDGANETDRPSVEPDETVDALTAILDSDTFAASPRSRDFLAYIVTEQLAGRADRLGEHAVARHALGRPRYDARVNSSVRVQATRVRAALERYYAHEGADAPVAISLPPGSYVPTIRRRRAPSDSPAADEAGVAVPPFEAAGPDAELISTTVRDAVVDRLAAFTGLRVVLSAAPPNSSEPTRPPASARFVLRGGVVATEAAVSLKAELWDAAADRVVWNIAECLPASPFDASVLEADWAAAVAGQVGDNAGVIFRRDAGAATSPGSDVYTARLAYTDYLMKGTSKSVATAAAALDRALSRGRRADLLTMRGALHNAEANQGSSSADRESELRHGEALAREALKIDPGSAAAHLVLGGTAWQRQDWDVAHAHAARAIELAPFHPTVLMSAGTVMAVAGDWQGGTAIMRRGFRLNPRHAGHAHAVPALACLMAGDDASALAEASLIHSPGQVWGPLYRALALGALGYLEQAWTEMSEVLEIDPHFLEDPGAYFSTRARLRRDQLEMLLAHFEPFTTLGTSNL